MGNLYISAPNVVIWSEMKDAESGAYENGATVEMSLFNKTAKAPSTEETAVQEVQTLVPSAPATAGTWTLTFEGQTTAAINYDATTAQVKTALEALSNIDVGDVVVGGDSLDTDPVVDGMTFTFKNTLGDVTLLTFDFSGLTGPTQAGSTMTETTKGVIKGEMINEGGGKVGIPIPEHELADTDYVRLQGFRSNNYNNKEYSIDSVKKNKIVIVETYAAETFTGNEKVYVGVPDGCNISLPYTGTDGEYRGILPHTLGRLIEYSSSQKVSDGLVETGSYYLFVQAVKDSYSQVKRAGLQAVYDT